MKILLKYGVNAIICAIKYNNNYELPILLLSILCKKRDVNILYIEVFLEDGADVNKECEYFTLLCILCSNNHLIMVWMLKHKSPNSFSINLLIEKGSYPI